jgi:hypothetical protein
MTNLLLALALRRDRRRGCGVSMRACGLLTAISTAVFQLSGAAQGQTIVTSFDGTYTGWRTLAGSAAGIGPAANGKSSQVHCGTPNLRKTLRITDGQFTFHIYGNDGPPLVGSVAANGVVHGQTSDGHVLTGQILSNVLTGTVGGQCQYNLNMQKQ